MLETETVETTEITGADGFTPELAEKLDTFLNIGTALMLFGFFCVVVKGLYKFLKNFF